MGSKPPAMAGQREKTKEKVNGCEPRAFVQLVPHSTRTNPRWRRDSVVDTLLGPEDRGDGGLRMFYIAERDGSLCDKVKREE